MRNNYRSQESFVLRKLREEKGLSRSELADMVGISWQTIKYWELNGVTPSLKVDEWMRLCVALDLKFSELPKYFSASLLTTV